MNVKYSNVIRVNRCIKIFTISKILSRGRIRIYQSLYADNSDPPPPSLIRVTVL